MHEDAVFLIAPEWPDTETLHVPVMKVFDGDGFLTRVRNPLRNVDTEITARFGFIDAPEIGQSGGQEAKDFLNRLIGNRWVDLVILTKIDTGGIFDRHGRIVCVPYLTHEYPAAGVDTISWPAPAPDQHWASANIVRNIELEMVLNGWAWVLERYGPDERYLDALADARRHKRGIWAHDHNVPPWEFKRQKYRKAEAANALQQQPGLFAPKASPCPADSCGGNLIVRSGKFGRFMGCSNYPMCRYSRSLQT